MATIEPYNLAGGAKRYQVRYRKPDNRQTKKRGFTTKRDAELFAATIEVSKAKGEYIAPKAGRLTVGLFAEQWYAGKANLKASTAARYRGVLDTHILPTWESVPLADVTPSGIQVWVSKLLESGRGDAVQRRGVTVGRGKVTEAVAAKPASLSAASVVKAHGVLSQILKSAVRNGRLSRNPAEGTDLPRVSVAEQRFLTVDQVDDLAAAAGEGQLVVLVLAYCGLRWGEMAALKVSRLDLLHRRLHVAEAVTEVDGRLVWGLPKNYQRRWVPIPQFLVDELTKHLSGKGPDDLVFPAAGGQVIRAGRARSSWFDPAVKASGMPGALHPHELRHTAASLAVSAGANVKSVQRMLGHSSAAMTLDRYSSLFDGDLEAVADRMDEIARRSRELRSDAAIGK